MCKACEVWEAIAAAKIHGAMELMCEAKECIDLIENEHRGKQQ
jgi:hypothetical protein